ncbi:MAG: hypothetical protein HWN65_13280 [Candidatus Helarchaeota archaeon]|nr:hypothetical protein [Candidatus Helarchaeota archaeon]
MPYVVTFCWYPPTVTEKVAQKYLENLQKNPVPSYIKRVVPAANAAVKEGTEIFNVDEVKSKDLGEAFEYINTFMLEFEEFEGFTWTIRIFSTVAEGLKRIGMG